MAKKNGEALTPRPEGSFPAGEVPGPLRQMLAGGGRSEDEVAAEVRRNRRANQKTGVSIRGGSGGIDLATGRPVDPMFYWKQSNLPYEIEKPEELAKVREFCRLLYRTNPTIATSIDVLSSFSVSNMEVKVKDPALKDFYTDLFFGDSSDLDYHSFLPEVNREMFTVGEAVCLGSFNETLGVWEADELINPDDVEVIRSPFHKTPRYQMKLPPEIHDVIRDRSPRWEYEQLVTNYPELVKFAGQDAMMPISSVLLKHLRLRKDPYNPRGIPLLMRAFRTVLQEEMLLAAQDSIASRLYTPLILARLGASASDLGTDSPWIPNDQDLMDFEERLDAALAGDMRILVHHFGVQMSSVFGRETLPNLTADFDRITERLLMVFGLSRTMLQGAGQGETYAADALHFDVVGQLMSTQQRQIRRFFRERAAVVAEAQEHYDYEVRNGKRYPIMEEVLVVDPDTGEERIIERPKLLIPDLQMRDVTMKEQADQRQFLEALRAAGVPISAETRLIGVGVDLAAEREVVREEAVAAAVEAQETRRQTYEALRDKGLPIPQDLREDFEPKPMGSPAGTNAGATPDLDGALPSIGTMQVDDAAIVPDYNETPGQQADVQPSGEEEAPAAEVVPLPRNKIRSRPPESDEERALMPKPASLVREADGKSVVEVKTEGGWVDVEVGEDLSPMLTGPKHVGMRRTAKSMRDADGNLMPLE